VSSTLHAAAPHLIGASAGSGKTHRLTNVVTAAVDPQAWECIDLRGLVAVTYTQKGASELASRIRRSFGGKGAHQTTQRLPLAYIGTVHAVCLRLVREFAIDAGLSPLIDVVPGGEARLLRQALEAGLEPALRKRLDYLAGSVELRFEQRIRRYDWLTPVHDIMTLVRNNRIAPEALPRMGERSAARFLELLGPVESDAAALDGEMLEALQDAASALELSGDATKKTGEARKRVSESLTRAHAHRMKWSDWLRMQKLAPGKGSIDAIEPLRQVAARFERHPRFRDELRELTLCMYEAARQGLSGYSQWKQHRRTIDFVDMLDRALMLVEHPDVRAELEKRFELVVVDEFQDTSPIQLALFVQLHALAGRSTWVGDPKQCIFEYAGADPELMDAVTHWVRESGGQIEQLPDNWRSRQELVEFSNALFTLALARHGYPADTVCTSARRKGLEGLQSLPPLSFWALQAKKNDEEADALAEGVRRLVMDPTSTPVHDRITDEVRGVRAGDIAMLVATNAEAERLAGALSRRGVFASIARAGLLATPEGTFVTAALRCLIEPDNALAVAEMEALTGFDGLDSDAWLARRLSDHAATRAAREAGEPITAAVRAGLLGRLESLRAEARTLAPSEAVDRVLARLEVAKLCRSWPDPKQRLANLDALRALAGTYEERCARSHEAATIAGLLRYFVDASEKVLVHDEEMASDDQHNASGSETITIVTYHRAKGLEWPVVILCSLGRERKRSAFEALPESEQVAFNPADPLGGRWIRYWPRPFTRGTAGRIEQAVAASAEGTAITEREARERVRLLYVGFTRARDHLILTARVSKAGYDTEWLDELRLDDGTPLLSLPTGAQLSEEGAAIVVGGGEPRSVSARCWLLAAGAPLPQPDVGAPRRWFSRSDGAALSRPSYWIAPSRAGVDWPNLTPLQVAEAVTFGRRLALGSDRSKDWDAVGSALHAFLAADLQELAARARTARAERLLAAAGLLGLLSPDALTQAGDNLRIWLDARFPGVVWQREVPVTAAIATPLGARRVNGTIDLLLETADGVVLIDHKSYPGARDTWQAKATEFAPQLAAYAEALRLAGKRVFEVWIHFTVGGGAVRLVPEGGANSSS
jgi:ATP-dependent helicase/nuclease subunit A